MPGRAALAALGLLLVAAVAIAHERHGAERHPAAAAPESAAATAGAAHAPEGGAGPARDAERFVMPPPGEALLEHLHNKLVHFPFALALAAALLLVLGRRRPELDLAGQWLVRLAALGGAAAYVTGRLQKEAFEGEPKEWLVGLHERWGTATAIVLVVWAFLTIVKPASRHAWLWGLVAAVLVLITGFYGGLVSHGE